MRRIKGGNLQKSAFALPDVVTKGIPAPTDGWDAISPLADMDEKRAPILQNWVPRPGWVELRGGLFAYVQGLPGAGPVETLPVYRPAGGAQRMFAITNNAIYEVSNPAQATQVAGGSLLSNRWQWTNFTPPNGTPILFLCSQGADQAFEFNGTTWSNPSITGFPNSWTTANIINVWAGKQRLWFVMANSTIAAFMPTGNITGAIAGYQDFGTLFSKGGFLVAIADWTIDGGEGPSSYMAFLSSEGQVALYQGIDPTNAASWMLVGVFSLPKPIGYRCLTQVGSDVYVITLQGLLPLSQALPYDPSADRSAAVTARIQNAMNLATQADFTNFGWEFITYPAQTLSILNVPDVTNQTSRQFVTNMLTGAWGYFTNWNFNTFALYNQALYGADNAGNIWQCYVGPSDGVAPIPADMQCAFNWFDEPGRLKKVTMIQPLLTSDGQITPNIAIDADFSSTAPSAQTQSIAPGAAWDSATAIWDTSLWGGGLVQVVSWLSAQAIGKALAIRMQVNVVPSGAGSTSVFDKATFDQSVFDGNGTTNITLQVNAFNAIMELGGFV